MGRPRKQVRAASFSVDAKMYKLLTGTSRKRKKNHVTFCKYGII